MWSMTTLVAPVVGPLLGGWITDNISWPWIFYINVPVGHRRRRLAPGAIYQQRETPTARVPVDTVGLGLLVLWVGALQVMLDKGKDLDWFNSPQIVALACVAVVAFAIFIIWELTEEHPIVDLSLFRRRNFWVGTVALLWRYGLYLRQRGAAAAVAAAVHGLHRNARGLVLAPVGLLAMVFTPYVGRIVHRVDPRILVTISFAVFALVLFMRAHFNTDATSCTLLRADADSGRGHGAAFFIPLMHHHAVGAAARAHPRRLGTLELRAHHGRLLRHLDHDDALGPPRHAASRAAGRAAARRQ